MTVCTVPSWHAAYEDPRTREYASRSALQREVEHGDAYGISLCAARGVDLNSFFQNGGGPPALEAASRGHVLALRRLIELRADPWKANADGITPLMMACNAGQDRVVEELLQHPDAPFLYDAFSKSSKATAASLAERRLARAKEDHRSIIQRFYQADAAFHQALAEARVDDLEQMISYRNVLEKDMEEAAAVLGRCEKVKEQLDALRVLRPPLLAERLPSALGTSLGLKVPDASAGETMSILAAAEVGAGKPIQTIPSVKANSCTEHAWNSIAQKFTEGRPESRKQERANSLSRLDLKSTLLGRPGTPRSTLATPRKAQGNRPRDRLMPSEGLQEVPFFLGDSTNSALLFKVRSRKKALNTDKNVKLETTPAILVAIRKLAREGESGGRSSR